MTAAKHTRLYIIGAGFAGQALAREIKTKAVLGELAAFLDDDAEKIGKKIEGAPVIGPIKDAANLLRMNPLDEAIIAIPSASQEYLSELYRILKDAGFAKIRILPGISQIVEGDAHLIQTRSIDPQDLLGRTPVAVNLKESLAYLRGKRVLVTGRGRAVLSEANCAGSFFQAEPRGSIFLDTAKIRFIKLTANCVFYRKKESAKRLRLFPLLGI